jgi:NAD+ synthetase
LIDGYEGHVVFDGNSLIMDSDGKIIFKGKAFEEELFIFDTEKEYEEINIEENEIKEIHDALVLGIKDYCRMSNFKGALIGLSGGIDSAVVAALATEALGKDNVIGITMPSHVTGEETRKDAELLANNFGITIYTNPIKDIFDILVNSLKTSSVLSDVKDLTLQNIQARVRGNLLMAVSNDTGKILLTTGNKTEIALGYFTLYGDSCGGMAVIGDVNKLQVYALANYINEKNGKELIPQTTITRPPTAELTTGQTDENSLGVPYDILSPLVEDIIENGKTIEELKEKYDNDLINKIIKLINTAEYKRRQIAPSIRVSNKAFGCGRRVPINICN